MVKNLSAYWLPDIRIEREIAGTVYAVTGSYEGTETLDKGINLTAAHTDAPRLDLKPNPVYEDHEQALLKTH